MDWRISARFAASPDTFQPSSSSPSRSRSCSNSPGLTECASRASDPLILSPLAQARLKEAQSRHCASKTRSQARVKEAQSRHFAPRSKLATRKEGKFFSSPFPLKKTNEKRKTKNTVSISPSSSSSSSPIASVSIPPEKKRSNRIPPREAPPLPLYSLLQQQREKKDSTIDPPKTGIDAQFMWPPPEHISVIPKTPELLVEQSPNLLASILRQDSLRSSQQDSLINRIVYDSVDVNPNSEKKSGSKINTPSAAAASGYALDPWFTLESKGDTTLLFESRFESGNLRRAIQVYEYEYDLIAKPDINTRGHTQWFYFSVSNTRKNQTYKINIINMVKNDSLYNWGMRPLLYSNKDAKKNNSEKKSKNDGPLGHGKERVGWRRCGKNISYYQNGMKRKSGSFYTLTFTVQFPHDNDTVYLAYCYPYTYTDLRRYLRDLENDEHRKKRFRRRALCTTLAGNTCDLLTITTFNSEKENIKSRKGIVVTARVHPGETNASWMMKGFIDYLTGPSLDARILRDNFVFKIVPMLNPDGVIVGNYRCSLAGIDLNRNYISPSRKLHPTIFYTKQMIKRFTQDREVLFYVDLHGHSKKMNVFMYGCESRSGENALVQKHSEKVFPRMLWKNSTIFSFRDCNFKVQKGKASTARVVVAKEIGIVNSYTMEATFAGANCGRLKGFHFSTREFESMGHFFCDTILDYCDPDQGKVQITMKELNMICDKPTRGNSFMEEESDDVGSDSTSEIDQNGNVGVGVLVGGVASSEIQKNQKVKKKKMKKNEKNSSRRKKKSSSTAGSAYLRDRERNHQRRDKTAADSVKNIRIRQNGLTDAGKRRKASKKKKTMRAVSSDDKMFSGNLWTTENGRVSFPKRKTNETITERKVKSGGGYKNSRLPKLRARKR